MEEDFLIKQLRKDLAEDFKPVNPLRESWKRALWVFPLSLTLMEVTLATFHLRPDYSVFNPVAFWGFCLLQVLVSYLILTVSLDACIPGSAKDPVFFIGVGIAGVAVQIALSWFIFRISPNSPAQGQEWHLGVACMLGVGMLGILASLFGFFLARAGLPLRARAAGLLFGLAGGLAAEASWRIHCPVSAWGHILLFHDGAIVAIIAGGIALGWIWERRTAARKLSRS